MSADTAGVAAFRVPPIEKTLLVPCDPARAFQAFTAEIAQWWPLKTHSISQAKAQTVCIEPGVGGRVYETSEDGNTCDWGRILTWSPPSGFSMTWHPGHTAETQQVVELSFIAEGDGTRVRLVHRGWETLGEKAQPTRDSYNNGWEVVFGRRFGEHLKRA
jgi:uncharacterized protein YndB with AHSA1/START domain